MNSQLKDAIIAGDATITVTMSAADLRSVVEAMTLIQYNRLMMDLANKEELASLSRVEAAKMLGVSPRTLSRWTEDGYVNTYKVGTKVLYKACEIKAMLNRPDIAVIKPKKRRTA